MADLATMIEANLLKHKIVYVSWKPEDSNCSTIRRQPRAHNLQAETSCSLLNLSPNSGSHQKKDLWCLTAPYGIMLTPLLSPKLAPSVYHNSTVPAQLGEWAAGQITALRQAGQCSHMLWCWRQKWGRGGHHTGQRTSWKYWGRRLSLRCCNWWSSCNKLKRGIQIKIPGYLTLQPRWQEHITSILPSVCKNLTIKTGNHIKQFGYEGKFKHNWTTIFSV